jgi:hypothetical protein
MVCFADTTRAGALQKYAVYTITYTFILCLSCLSRGEDGLAIIFSDLKALQVHPGMYPIQHWLAGLTLYRTLSVQGTPMMDFQKPLHIWQRVVRNTYKDPYHIKKWSSLL